MIKRIFSAVPGLLAAALPNATCPACWPVYAGVLSSLGLGFLMQGTYFYLIIGLLLAVSLLSLSYKSASRRGLRPFALGVFASIGIIAGKIAEWPEVTFYTFASVLLVASVWNNWPIKKSQIESATNGNSACPNCKTKPMEV